jgi:carboxyl-terminal processing protease
MIYGMKSKHILGLLLGALLGLAACGGGDGSAMVGGTPPAPPPAGGITYTPGVFQPFSTFAAQCQTPRTGTNPATNRAYPDQQGSVTAENHWLRSWSQDYYLWYRELPEVNPASVATASVYFDQMKTTIPLNSGQVKDRFHFTYNTAEWQQLSQSGVVVGYGISWVLISGRPPRKIMVEFVEPGSVAATAGITRGAEIITADGVDVVNSPTQADVDRLNAALFPKAAGAHQFVFKDRGTGASRSVSLNAGPVTLQPVPVTSVLSTATGNVGYIAFNDHIATAEAALIAAVNQLKAANIQDLILDLRYNGGGFLDIASELAYMIAGPGPTAGRVFERLQFNDKYPNTNPVTRQALTPTPFLTTTQGFSVASGQALPTLNLSRVYVLTSSGTCSASESAMNGLRGAGITVYQIGPDTCGKPYGFYPTDNCGTTYFTIQFKGVNNNGFGDYVEGFSATRTNVDPQAKLPGCAATDDLTRDLGDPNEERLRVARVFRETGVCTGTGLLQEAQAAAVGNGGVALELPDQPWRESRILR